MSEISHSPSRESNDGSQQIPRLQVAQMFMYIAIIAIYSAFVGSLTGLTLIKLEKQQMMLSVTQLATLNLILGIPAYFQPFFGAGSDLKPIFGYRRRPYYLVGALVEACGVFLLSHTHQFTYMLLVALLLIVYVGSQLQTIAQNATMVRIGNNSGTFGIMISTSQMIGIVFSILITAHLTGVIAHFWTFQHAALIWFITIITRLPLVFLLPEKREMYHKMTEEERRDRHAQHQEQTAKAKEVLKKTLKMPGTWAITLFIFYLIITPGSSNATYFFERNVVHLSSIEIGNLGKYSAIGNLLGLCIFALVSYFLSVRSLVWNAFLMDCVGYPLMYQIHSYHSAEFVSLFTGATGTLYSLCLFTLAAKATPRGIEGTIYGMIMASIALAGSLSELMGAKMYDYFSNGHSQQYAWNHMLIVGFLFTIVAIVLIPFLPAWAKSKEPLKPEKRPSLFVSRKKSA